MQEWITRRNRELAANDGVYSFEDWNLTRAGIARPDDISDHNDPVDQMVDADGDYTNTDGTTLSADVGMMRKPVDFQTDEVRIRRDLIRSRTHPSKYNQVHESCLTQ